MKTFSMFLCNRTKETEEKLVFLINSQINQVKKCNCVDIDRKLNSLYHCSIAFANLIICNFTICWNMFTYSIINWIYYFESLLFYRLCTGTLPGTLCVYCMPHFFFYGVHIEFLAVSFSIVPRPSIVNNVFYKELQYC